MSWGSSPKARQKWYPGEKPSEAGEGWMMALASEAHPLHPSGRWFPACGTDMATLPESAPSDVGHSWSEEAAARFDAC